jgi:hypothetical protein
MMSARLRSFVSMGAALSLAATGLLGLCVPTSQALAERSVARSGSLLKIGEGSSPIPGVPAIKVEVPSLGSGSSPAVEVGVDEHGVSVTTPVTPKVEVPAPKVEVPAPKVEVPGTPTVPVQPPSVEKITTPTGGGGSSRGSSGGSGSGSAGGSGSASTGAGATAAGLNNAGAGGASTTRHTATRGSGGKRAPAGKGARPGAGGTSEPGTGGSGGSPTPAGKGDRVAGTKVPARSAKHNSSDPLTSIGRGLPLPLPVPDWSKPIILLLLVMVLAFGLRWWRATRRARRLERRQDSLLRDIEVMQAALAPEVPARLEDLALSVAYRPAEGPAAGGDFYDVFVIAPGRVAMILGDVAGHGHDALRQATLTRYTVRAFLKETGDPRAALALSGHALSEPGVEQLATVAIAIFDGKRGTLTYALAGHPPPILLGVPLEQASSACSSPPLGCEIATGRRQRTIGLAQGARACFFSDGLIEARRSVTAPGGHPDLLGAERLEELLAGLAPGAGAKGLLEAVRTDAVATPDDMAACILTSEAEGVRQAIDIEELEVDRHALDGGHLAAYLHASGVNQRDAERALRATGSQLDAHDTAVLLVDRSGGGEVEICVRAGGERLSGAAEMRRVEPGATTRLTRA